jgi:hypothetical protein
MTGNKRKPSWRCAVIREGFKVWTWIASKKNHDQADPSLEPYEEIEIDI